MGSDNEAHPQSESPKEQPQTNDTTTATTSTSTTTTNSQTPAVKKRVRTGCLNCRRKHKKCDEVKPICTTCSSKNELCEWPNPRLKNSSSKTDLYGYNQLPQILPYNRPILVNPSQPHPHPHSHPHSHPLPHAQSHTQPFQLGTDPADYKRMRIDGPSRMIPAPVLSQNIHSGLPTSIQPRLPFVTPQHNNTNNSNNNSNNSNNNNNNSKQPYENWKLATTSAIQNILNAHPTAPTNNGSISSTASSSTSMSHESDPNPPKEREYILSNSAKFVESQQIFLDYLSKREVPSMIPSLEITPNLTEKDEILLYKYYIKNLATQYDFMHVNSNIFAHVLPVLSKPSPPLRYSILALSLVHWVKSNHDNQHQFNDEPLRLFQMAVAQFVKNSESYSNTIRVATALFLVSFCMTVTDQSSWRDLVKGLVNFIKAEDIRPIQRELANFSLFWIVAILDISTTDLMKEKTLLSYDFETLRKFSLVPQMIGYLSMTFNLLVLDTSSSPIPGQDNFDNDWEKLWIKVSQWGDQIEEEHLETVKEFENSPFPGILCHSAPSVMTHQLYAVAKILLLQDRPRLFRNKYQDPRSLAWYAKRIGGLLQGNQEYQNWAITPLCLWLAGKVLTHEDEHKALLELFEKVENKYGPIDRYRSEDLKGFWQGKSVIM